MNALRFAVQFIILHVSHMSRKVTRILFNIWKNITVICVAEVRVHVQPISERR